MTMKLVMLLLAHQVYMFVPGINDSAASLNGNAASQIVQYLMSF